MVKSRVCPKCLEDLDAFYTEEGDTMVSSNRITCPQCGFTLEGAVSEYTDEVVSNETEPSDNLAKERWT